jgi:ribosomal protein S18 acetylase RimI-like enzyme
LYIYIYERMILEIKFRRALKTDLKFLLDLRKQTMTPHLIASSLPISEKAHLQRIDYKFEHALIIEMEDIPIGLLKVDKQHDNIDLIQIQITPNYQGKGVGRKILNDLIKEAIETEKSITLSVLKTNQAKKLYLNVGFKIVGETDNSYLMLSDAHKKRSV